MEVKIGVQYAARELVIETDDSSESIEKVIADAVAGGADGGSGILALTDSKGRKIVVPADKIAYVEIGGGVGGTVGFRS